MCHILRLLWRFLHSLFTNFSSCRIILFVIFDFWIIAFIIVIFVLVVPLFFSLDYLLTVFIDLSGFVVVMKYWFVCTCFTPALFSLVPMFTASCASTLVLLLYVKGFVIFSWIYWYWLFVHLVKFHLNIVTDPLNG